jgi:hypothetical protein
MIVPLPRYVLSPCCGDNTSHVASHLKPGFTVELYRAEKSLAEVSAVGNRTGEARIVNILSFFTSAESSFWDLTAVDGTSIWVSDGSF